MKVEAAPTPSRESLRGLDWFIFFLADVQTGFGPFVAVYLTTQKWTQVEIGFVLSIGGVVALIGQVPGGALVDAARSERLVAALAVVTIGCSALAYAAWPIFPVVAAAATLHAAASCVLGPAIAAISLGLVGPLAIGERFGRNARFASLGNGVAAALMGTCGYLLSSRSVFLVTFILAIPTLLALARIREREVNAAWCHGSVPREAPGVPPPSPAQRLNLTGKDYAKAERCLANAIYFESRSEPVRGQMAVAQVVVNRAFSGFYPNDICGVVYQNANRHLSCQFTFACDGKSKAIHERGEWARANRIAKQTLDGQIYVPEVAKSTHYHAIYVHPNWVGEMKKMVRYGLHNFYRPYAWGNGAEEPAWGIGAMASNKKK